MYYINLMFRIPAVANRAAFSQTREYPIKIMLKIIKEITDFTKQNNVEVSDNDDIRLFNAMVSCQTRKKQFSRFIKGKASEYKHFKSIGEYETCRFGKWINGRGKDKFGDTKEWKLLSEAHANSHLMLLEIKKLKGEGQEELALELLKGPYKELELIIQRIGGNLYRKLLTSQQMIG